MIHGVAIDEGITRNGVKYLGDELRKSAGTLRNKPLLKDHEAKIDNVVGRTTERCEFNETTKSIDFEAKVMDEKIIEMIMDGRITNVSIGAMVADISEEEEVEGKTCVIAKGIEFLELSLVPVPGCPGATISQALQEAFKLKQEETKTINEEAVLLQSTESKQDLKSEVTIKLELSDEVSKIVQDEKLKNESTEKKLLEEKKMEEDKMILLEKEKTQAIEAAKVAEAETVKLKEQLESIRKAEYDKSVSEYKALAEGLKIKVADTTNLTKENVEALTEALKNMRTAQETVVPKGQAQSTNVPTNTEKFDKHQLMIEEGRFVFYRK